MRELEPGLWWWEAVHPEWTEADAAAQDWGPEVSSYAIEDGGRLLLFDPTTPPAPVDGLAASLETVVILTCPWHQRDTAAVAERFGAAVYSPSWNTPGQESPGEAFVAGDRLPVGVQAFPGLEPNDLVLWVESRHALVAGDTLIDRGNGLEFPADWANKDVPAEEILESLRQLLALPVQSVLPTHGPPANAAALAHALA